MTIKGRSHGATRAEFEYEIPLDDADALLAMCLPPIIEKVRHRVPYAGLVWEVDVFGGVNEGLVVAEVELPSEDDRRRPAAVGRRRGDRRPSLLQRQPHRAPVPGLALTSLDGRDSAFHGRYGPAGRAGKGHRNRYHLRRRSPTAAADC